MITAVSLVIAIGIVVFYVWGNLSDPIQIIKRRIGKLGNQQIFKHELQVKGRKKEITYISDSNKVVQAGYFHNEKASPINDSTKPVLDKIGFRYEDLTEQLALNEWYGIMVRKVFRVQRLGKMNLYSIEAMDGRYLSYLENTLWNESIYSIEKGQKK
jgi:hypothetical protein